MISKPLMSRVQRAAQGAMVIALSLTALECKKSPTAPAKVAAANVTVNTTAATIQALNGQTLTFQNGASAFSPTLTGNVTMAIAATSTSSTAALTFSTGTQNTTLTFGSCIFTPTAPNLAGFPAGGATVNPCTITAATAGKPADGSQNSLAVTVSLGGIPSVPVNIPVTISENGEVKIGTTVIGTVPTTQITGGN
jgi:hypothetical protein